MRTKKIILSICFFLVYQFNYSQCAMCKAVVESGDNKMAEGVNDGITYLMIFPYLLVGVLLYSLYRYNKKLQK
ncbi:hypothetical protein IU405_14600 [Polaribacter sp. BAL334]|jgi:hypothetical protein|nr:hypothetical protein [Polaribacter sp. BAL334]MBG7613481.1 hypothetical protein [Polaribacter sp. BAL334]